MSGNLICLGSESVSHNESSSRSVAYHRPPIRPQRSRLCLLLGARSFILVRLRSIRGKSEALQWKVAEAGPGPFTMKIRIFDMGDQKTKPYGTPEDECLGQSCVMYSYTCPNLQWDPYGWEAEKPRSAYCTSHRHGRDGCHSGYLHAAMLRSYFHHFGSGT